MDNRLPQIRKCRRDTLEKHFLFCFSYHKGNQTTKVFNLEYFIEQLHVKKTIRYEISWQSKLFILQ